MKNILKILKFWPILIQTTFAAQTLAVLEIIPATDDIEITVTEYRHLTDELRRQAVRTLPSTDYAVLTRDNIISLLPPDEEAAQCLAESCAVDIGRAIGAEFISQGRIGIFGGDLSLSIELYETMGGKLLSSIVIESKDVKGLMAAIREQAPELFSKIKPLSEPRFSELKVDSQDEKPKMEPIPVPQKSSKSFYIAIGLDIIGAAVLGFGIYQHINASSLQDDYKKMPWLPPEQHGQYEDARKKANDATTMGNIGIAIGSALLATGIAVHIWF